MADTILQVRPTNGVSLGARHTVTAADVSNGAIVFDFGAAYPVAATILVCAPTTGAVVALADAKITYPEAGQVRLEEGAATFSFEAGQIISVVAQRARIA